MLFLPIFILSITVFAQEDLAVETYCFSTPMRRAYAEKKLTSILVPSDKIESEGSCFTVQMRPHRRELLQNYTRNIDPDMFVKFSSTEIKHDPCKLKVEKVRKFLKNNSNVQLSQIPHAQNNLEEVTSSDVMHIQTLNDFSLTVAHDVIEGKCRFINSNTYEIQITAKRDPRPTLPANLPPGTIVINQTQPEEQKTMAVSSTLQLKRGERVEMGSIVKDLKKNDRNLDIKPEAQISNTDGQETEKVFLSFQ